jgi:Rnl2 family RNA ligase
MSSTFQKYFSIEGTWRKKEIQWWIEKYPKLINQTYVLQEKIHGANISLLFSPDGDFKIAKRSGFISENEKFYNHQIINEKYADIILLFKELAVEGNHHLIVYGEWFGEGIQKGVDYGPEKQLLLFDVIMDDRLLPQFEMENMFSVLNIEDMMVPILGMTENIKDALDFPIEDRITEVYPEGKSVIEGVVIKLFYTTFFEMTNEKSAFYLKKKNEKFKEMQSKKKKIKINKYPEYVELLKTSFNDYITDNRLDSVFSHYGEIVSYKDIGKYIKFFIEDAKEEFTKDHKVGIMDCTDKELRYVYNSSKEIVKMLKERM